RRWKERFRFKEDIEPEELVVCATHNDKPPANFSIPQENLKGSTHDLFLLDTNIPIEVQKEISPGQPRQTFAGLSGKGKMLAPLAKND
ncbi:hypothetical protein BGZ46_005695, partial [Entomortierella lignicola]